MTSSLVSCEWLNEKIQSGNLGDIVVLDVSWASKNKDVGYDKDYKEKHIPGAHYLNVLDSENNAFFVRNLPTPEKFTEIVQKVGVNKTSHVVLYSNSDKAGYFLTGRGWWTFRVYGCKNVSILDGGLEKWEKLGYKTTQEIPSVKPGDFVASKEKDIYKTYENVIENQKTGAFQLVDTRDDKQYNDCRIPGAKHLFMGNLIDQSNSTLKSDEELKAEFAKAGIDLTKPVVTHCNGGMSSSTVAFVAEKLGQKNIAVFHGGWTEWSKKQDAENKK